MTTITAPRLIKTLVKSNKWIEFLLTIFCSLFCVLRESSELFLSLELIYFEMR